MEVTKREILVSICIIAIMIVFGFLISNEIWNRKNDKNAEYNKAIKIETQDLFQYGMGTNAGNAFVYGKLKAVDSVTYPEIGGEYVYIKKVKERYTMHTRTVTTGTGKNCHTRTETYWTWDEIQSEEIHSSKITFLEIEFDYSKIEMPAAEHIGTIQESGNIRYKYYGCKEEYVGTIYTDLRNNTISDKTKFYEMDMNETIKYLESRPYEIIFWSIWILLTIGLVYAFCYFENRWLDD